MREPQAKAVHLKDYTPPAFRVDTVDLDVDIREDHALVRRKAGDRRTRPGPLVLDGDEVELVSRHGKRQAGAHDSHARVAHPARRAGRVHARNSDPHLPQKNTKLEGLYATKNGFVTQCEAQGFRRITWFIDRPDVMARYTTTVRADRSIRCCCRTAILVRIGPRMGALRGSVSQAFVPLRAGRGQPGSAAGQATSTSTSSRASSTRPAGRWTA